MLNALVATETDALRTPASVVAAAAAASSPTKKQIKPATITTAAKDAKTNQYTPPPTPPLPASTTTTAKTHQQVLKADDAWWLSSIASVLNPWSHVLNLSQKACLGVLRKMKHGHVRIVIPSKVRGGADCVLDYGDADAKDTACVRVLQDSFWMRLMVYGALGFGEGYMYGEVEVTNLATLLLIFIRNRDHFSEMNLLPPGVNRLINAALHSHIPNTLYNSLYNIRAHYDLGNEMFASFLDETMTYSCPIWDGEHDTLESAQIRKIRAMLEMARVRDGDRVLEVGTGWGALAIECCRMYPNATVTTLTLSSEQKALAEERIEAAGFSDRVTVLLQDYRSLDANEYEFDRIVTVEMLEAVGPEFLHQFFAQADALLHPRRGTLALQVITMPDSRYADYLRKVDFIQKHIFPGGHCPSVTALVGAIEKGSKGKLIVDELSNIGPHYAKALRVWRERFLEGFDGVVEETGLDDVYTEEFKRKWEF
ncbi:hypothetical protein HK101_001889, partial [Irineochytrium annulatum]